MTADVEARLRATLTRVAESTEVSSLPSLGEADGELAALFGILADPQGRLRIAAPRTSLPRRRRAMFAAVVLVVLGGGLSAAASAGLPVLPGPVMAALGWQPEPGAYEADPATGRILLTVPGPGGQPLYLWYSDASDNGYCVSLTSVVAPASRSYTVDPTRMPRNGVGAGGCGGPIGDSAWRTFGGDAVTSADDEATSVIVRVPGAQRVLLELDDGTSRAWSVADGWTAGWLTGAQMKLHPVLVGYAADGVRVGTYECAAVGTPGGGD